MGRLREGYKQTELGVIPEDWEIISISTIGNTYTGLSGKKAIDFGSGEARYIPFLNILKNPYIDITSLESVSIGNDELQNKVRFGDLFFNTSSETPDEVGMCSVLLNNIPNLYLNSFCFGFRLFQPNRVNGLFLSYYFRNKQGRELMNQLAQGSTRYNLAKANFLQAKIGLPSQKEQKAISEVLNDIDSLIEALDKKIAKKRAIKEGAMQQLLTGKKRLKGFTKPWVEKNFEEILGKQIRKGQILTVSDYVGGVIPVIAGGKTPAGYHAYYNRDRNTITISASGANAGFIAFYRDPIFATDCSTINESTKYDIKFIFFLLCLYQDVIYKAQTGGAQPHIHAKDIYPLVVLYTTNTKEQQAIAQILTDMDDEIQQLENERQKYTALKQGAMQQLLTGQIRLMAESKAQVQVAEQPQKQANIHFKRSVWAAEIVDRLCGEPTFGHVKMEKLIFLTEHMCGIDLGSNYHRDAAGPYDNRAIRSIDSQLKKQNWFEAVRKDKGYRYIPMGKRGGHKDYFDRYYHKEQAVFDKVINTCRSWNTERCEIVATLYSAWKDLGSVQKQFTDDDIINEVINNWNESKRRIPEERWRKALGWMRENGFAPISI